MRSAWSSPAVLVPKPDGTFRFCNDFRRLNEVSDFDAYPMPRVDKLFELLGPAPYLTNLDFTKRYWQVPLTRTARKALLDRITWSEVAERAFGDLQRALCSEPYS